MLNFVSFGSGSSGNCYYIFTEDEGFLIDAGIGLRTFKKLFMEYGFKQNRISCLLLTHDHADHSKSSGSFSKSLNLPIYATQLTFKGIDGNDSIRKKPEPINRNYIAKGSPFNIGTFTITPFDVPHDSLDCVGYRIEHNGVVLCLITDVGEMTTTIGEIISQADYLIIEANYDELMLANGNYPPYLKQRIKSGNGHLSNKMCGQALKLFASEKLRSVYLCHLSQENNTPDLAVKTVSSSIENVPIIALKRKGVSGPFKLYDKEVLGDK